MRFVQLVLTISVVASIAGCRAGTYSYVNGSWEFKSKEQIDKEDLETAVLNTPLPIRRHIDHVDERSP